MTFSAGALLRGARARSGQEAIWVAIAVFWFAVVFSAIAWVWSLDPQVTLMPDEAVNRQAAELLRRHGTPLMALPFADPEDLAHPRFWLSIGDRALPAYAPVTIYWFAMWLRLGALGLVMIIALPASGVAAFAAGVAKLLPSDRRWIALPAPLLCAPALYWLARSWMNVSLLLSGVCWAVFFWASWRSSGRARFISYAAAAIGAAAAVRPDYAAYLFVLALLIGLTAGPVHTKRVLVSILAAGSAAVAVNLLLNALTTGDPLLAAYQIQVARHPGGEESGAASSGRIMDLLSQLLVPMGVPTLKTALGFLGKYWLRLGHLAGLAIAQLALVPLLFQAPRSKRWLYGLALLVMFCFMLSRMDPGLFGAAMEQSTFDHSIPRYWSPIYLLAALPPVLLLARTKHKIVLVAGSLAIFGLALANGYDICVGERWSLSALRAYRLRNTALAASLIERIPSDGIVYTRTQDKILWRKWRLGTIDEPQPSAKSMARAVKAGLQVYAFEPQLKRSDLKRLERALKRHGLKLDQLRPRGLRRIVKD
jgi:hypothetical protein